MIGFDFFTNIKTDYFMKYSDLMIGPRPGYDLDDEENEESIVEFEVQLTDKILTEKRSYSKSIDILGEVGGFMEIISIIFGLVLSIIVDFLYEISVVNNLFSFDLKFKYILIKNNKDNFKTKNYNHKKVNTGYKKDYSYR